MDLALHAGQVLSYTGLLVLAPNGGQFIHITALILGVSGPKGEREGVEGFGLFGWFLVAMSLVDFILAEGVEGGGGLVLFAFVADLPEVFGGKLLVVSSRLDHLGHQQWVIIMGR
jgi:hypothetical protein